LLIGEVGYYRDGEHLGSDHWILKERFSGVLGTLINWRERMSELELSFLEFITGVVNMMLFQIIGFFFLYKKRSMCKIYIRHHMHATQPAPSKTCRTLQKKFAHQPLATLPAPSNNLQQDL
jgi:hypothetical protein